MYNLLIVDDELVISKYIAEVFRNSDMMGDILLDVQNATSGFDALEIMEEGYIDIVLTDISMPGMSGIELMERINKKWPNVKVILMSVYNEFQYVQAAIRNNSVDYVLKSEGEEQLIASVKKAVDELEQELRSEEIVKKAAQNLKLANAVLRERIIIDMIEGEKQNLETLKDYFDEIDMPLDISKQTFMIIGKVTMSDMSIITNARLYKIKAFVEEHLKRNMSCVSAIYERRLILLLQYKNETDITKGTINSMINQLYRIQRILNEMLNVDISFSTDEHPIEWSKIDIKYEHLNSALGMMPSMATDIILIESHRDEYSRCPQGKDGNEVEEMRLAIRQLETLGIYFTDGKKEGFLELYDSLMRIFRNLSPQYDTVKYEAVYILASQFLAAINKLSISDRNKLASEIISKVKKYENWNEIEIFFRNIAEQMFQARDEEAFTNINRVIDFISKYAMEHLNEDLSLNRFAKLLHYHPSYLSRLFKQATGTAFSDYIAEIRLNKAKNMLCKGDMKITNIAKEQENIQQSEKSEPLKEDKEAGETPEQEKKDPFGKYPEPIEITACRVKTSWMGFDSGEDENNNWWSRTYLEQLNIKLNVVWTAPNWGEPLDTKITTCIATDDLPDLMPVYGSLAQRLAIAGKAMDVKDIIDEYASDKVMEYLNYADGRALKGAMYDGKMIGIPNPGGLVSTYDLLWYRSDWLQKLGLEKPKTLEDIENLARAFKDQDPDGNGEADTYGIAADKNFGGLELVLNMYGAYQGWIEKDGKLEFGLIQPEVKSALSKLHEWYKEGLLAVDFAVKDPNNELQADIASGKVGIMFDGSHFPNGGAGRALKKNNPDAEVDWAIIPTPEGQPAKQYTPSRANDFNVISYKCKHPEAIMKLINLKVQIFDPIEKPDFLKDLTINEYDTTKEGNMSFWNAVVSFDNIGKNYIIADLANEEIRKGGDGSSLPLDAKSTFNMMNSWLKEGTKADNYEVNWAMYKLFNAENGSDLISYRMAEAEPDKYRHYDAFGGIDTPAMAKYGSDIHTKSIEYFIKAIMEGNIEEQFEEWVKYFHNNGGDLMTKEANEWYENSKK